MALGNVVYAPYTNSSGDSLVLFSPPAAEGSALIPGRIEFILQEPKDTVTEKPRTVIIVRPFQPLAAQETVHDPYFNNPIIGHQGADIARLYYNEFEDRTYLIEPQDLVSHIAVCLYADLEGVLSQSAVVILSLDWKHERFA